jgi:ankyrin repeat protein
MSGLTITKAEAFERYKQLLTLINERIRDEKNLNTPLPAHPTTYNFTDIHGFSLLHYATIIGDVPSMERLVENGANLKAFVKNSDLNMLQLAFNYGNLEAIQYLLSKNLPLSWVYRETISDNVIKAFYDSLIEDFKLRLLIEKATDINSPCINFPYKDKNELSARGYLNFAAEIGNIDFIKNFAFQKTRGHSNKIEYPLNALIALQLRENINPLISAVNNGQHAALEALLNLISPDILPPFTTNAFSALHAAATKGDWKSAELLLKKKANINNQDKLGQTPLYLALLNGHAEFAKNLIAQEGVKLNLITMTGESILHASYRGCPSLIPELEVLTNHLGYQEKTNIFGQKPQDFAIPIDNLAQDNLEILNKISYFYQLLYRDTDYLSEGGYCNGFVFLFHYFSSIKKVDFFLEAIKVIAAWDGTVEKLKTEMPAIFTEYNRHLKQLVNVFEYFSYWLAWHQQDEKLASETHIEKFDRELQTEDKIHYLFKEIIYESIGIHQLNELHAIYAKLPPGIHIEASGEGHVLGFNTEENNFSYYDSNYSPFVVPKFNAEQLSEIIINTKYRALYGRDSIQVTKISAYYYPWDNVDMENYAYFKETDYPTSRKAAQEFIRQSPNRFSHLHVAVMTNSVINVKALIEGGNCDINAKDAQGMTALSLAVQTGNRDIIQLLLVDKNSKVDIDALLVLAYNKKFTEVLTLLWQHSSSQFLPLLLQEAVTANDLTTVKSIISEGKVSISHIATVLHDQNFSVNLQQPSYRSLYDYLNNIYTSTDDKEIFYDCIAQKNEKIAWEILKTLDLSHCSEAEKYDMLIKLLSIDPDSFQKQEMDEWQYDLIISLLAAPGNFSIEQTVPLITFLSNSPAIDKKPLFDKLFQHLDPELLIQKNSENSNRTILHDLCEAQLLDAIVALLECNATGVNDIDENLQTPLHILLSNNDLQDEEKFLSCVTKLLTNNANPTSLDCNNMAAIDIAREQNNEQIMSVLDKAKARLTVDKASHCSTPSNFKH